jgi:2,3-bisphosphoglycerate-dependent phosphoglycerate mutase
LRWDGCRVLIIGHGATRWGLEHVINSASAETLISSDSAWQEGWEYRLG